MTIFCGLAKIRVRQQPRPGFAHKSNASTLGRDVLGRSLPTQQALGSVDCHDAR
jgi:hypothetical protein